MRGFVGSIHNIFLMIPVDDILNRKDVRKVIADRKIDDMEFARKIAGVFTRRPSLTAWGLSFFRRYPDMDLYGMMRSISEHIDRYHQWVQYIPGGMSSYTRIGTDRLSILLRMFETIEDYDDIHKMAAKFPSGKRVIILGKGLQDSLETIKNGYSGLPLSEEGKIARAFNTLPSNMQRNFIRTMTPVDNVTEFKLALGKLVIKSYDWTPESFRDYFRDYIKGGSEIVYDDHGVIVVEFNDFRDCASLCNNGRSEWCIARDEYSFFHYVDTNVRQYAIFDFNLPEHDDLSLIGVTIDVDEKEVVASHTRENHDIFNDFIRRDDNSEITFSRIPDEKGVPWGVFYWDLWDVKEGWSFTYMENAMRNIDGEFTYIDTDRNLAVYRCEVDDLWNNWDSAPRLPTYSMNVGYVCYLCCNFNVDYSDNKAIIPVICMSTDGVDYIIAAVNKIGDGRSLKWLKKMFDVGFTDFIPSEKRVANSDFVHYCMEGAVKKAEALIAGRMLDYSEKSYGHTEPIWKTLAKHGLWGLLSMAFEDEDFDGELKDSWNVGMVPYLFSLYTDTKSKRIKDCIIKYLSLKSDDEVSSYDENGAHSGCLLNLAIDTRDPSLIDYLISRGCDINTGKDLLGRTPAVNLAIHSKLFDRDYVYGLITGGESVNALALSIFNARNKIEEEE